MAYSGGGRFGGMGAVWAEEWQRFGINSVR